jgi:hypothetical protein
MYGSIIFLQYLYILARSFRTHLRKYIIFINIKIKKNILLMLMGFLMFAKWRKFTTKKNQLHH